MTTGTESWDYVDQMAKIRENTIKKINTMNTNDLATKTIGVNPMPSPDRDLSRELLIAMMGNPGYVDMAAMDMINQATDIAKKFNDKAYGRSGEGAK